MVLDAGEPNRSQPFPVFHGFTLLVELSSGFDLLQSPTPGFHLLLPQGGTFGGDADAGGS